MIAGHNNPPEPTPLELAREAVEAVRTEAAHWLDGTAVETQAQADEVGKLMRLAGEAARAAEAWRVAEKAPHLEAGKAVDAAFKPILADAERIKAGCSKLLAPWLQRQEQERQAALRLAREAEDAARRAAAEAARQAEASTDLGALDASAEAAQRAREAETQAREIATSKPAVETLEGSRRVTLRSVWTGAVTDLSPALLHYLRTDKDAVLAAIQALVDRDVRAGARSIPGVTVTETKVAR